MLECLRLDVKLLHNLLVFLKDLYGIPSLHVLRKIMDHSFLNMGQGMLDRT